MLKKKIKSFLKKVDGRAYTSKSLSKVLHIKHETARKYLREMSYKHEIRRYVSYSDKGNPYRYFIL
jgi:response regulator of citrate/malate metabolism